MEREILDSREGKPFTYEMPDGGDEQIGFVLIMTIFVIAVSMILGLLMF